jgi:hypothetical protein
VEGVGAEPTLGVGEAGRGEGCWQVKGDLYIRTDTLALIFRLTYIQSLRGGTHLTISFSVDKRITYIFGG